tara:strand:- start:2627 stop:2950 length:324 start_codon:yes stop_codon:yes gene_type:complete
MVKYFKVTISGDDLLIPVDGIITIKKGAATTQLEIQYSKVVHDSATAPEVLVCTVNVASATAAQQQEQLNALVSSVAEALSTAWTKPLYTLSLPYAPTSIAFSGNTL